MIDPANGTRVWLFDETATILHQTVGPLTESAARFITTDADAVTRTRWVSQGRKITYLNDWRLTQSYEAKGRELLIKWGKDSLKHTEHVWIQIAPDAPGFIRVAVRTGISVLKLLRMPIDQSKDFTPLLAPLLSLTPVRLP